MEFNRLVLWSFNHVDRPVSRSLQKVQGRETTIELRTIRYYPQSRRRQRDSFFWSNLEEKQRCQNEKVTTRGAKTRLAIEGWYVQEGQVLVDTDVRGGCRLIVKTAFRFQSEALCPERALSSRHRQLDNAESQQDKGLRRSFEFRFSNK
uniref:uncharacterized protein LOC117154891 isoform X2 n=1 Tax=Bombus vancouverensis nearcticus TaxID=2705178 RepID=UPI00143CA503|nr:uncharacterized protein LOC117154891 isoform X2 [Bombus vancouverensis nearcticus]